MINTPIYTANIHDIIVVGFNDGETRVNPTPKFFNNPPKLKNLYLSRATRLAGSITPDLLKNG